MQNTTLEESFEWNLGGGGGWDIKTYNPWQNNMDKYKMRMSPKGTKHVPNKYHESDKKDNQDSDGMKIHQAMW